MNRLSVFVIIALALTGCMSMDDFNTKESQKPHTYPKYDPNCTRHIPTTKTANSKAMPIPTDADRWVKLGCE